MFALKEWVHRHYRKDGAFSWIICFCSVISVSIANGIDSSFGVIVSPLIHEFNATEVNVAWIGSIHTATQYFSASAASSLLTRQIGLASIIVIGAFITCISCAIVTLSTNVFHLVLTHGLLGGTGAGMFFMAGTTACSFHFDENHGLSSGAVFTGGGIGIMVVSFYSNIITATYGWKGYFLFCASICPLTCLLACIIYVVPNEDGGKENSSNEIRRLLKDDDNEESKSLLLVRLLLMTKLH